MEIAADGAAIRYWDHNRERTLDPGYWMADPAVRQAINRRVSGDPNCWPLDWFQKKYLPVTRDLALSVGCGIGALERAAARLRIARRIVGVDGSPASLEMAQELAAREGHSNIEYRAGNFNDLVLPAGAFDVIFFHASMHHVGNLEGLFEQIARSLRPGGLLYIDEYIGPSRHEWNADALDFADALYRMLPRLWRRRDRLVYPIEPDDPSEAIRSAEIPAFLRSSMEVLEQRSYGGHLLSLILPELDPATMSPEQWRGIIDRLIAAEERDLRLSDRVSYYAVFVARSPNRPPVPAVRTALRSLARAVGRRLIG
jgi:SAM-dependent methyltransferase